MFKKAFFSLLIVFLFAFNSHSEPNSTNAELTKAGLISAIGLGTTFGFRLMPAPFCYWCRVNRFDETFTRAFLWDDVRSVRLTSDLAAFLLVPLMSVGSIVFSSENKNNTFRDLLIVFASFTGTMAITEIVKVSSRRMRPDAAFGMAYLDHETNRSFFSGHTSLTFAMLTSSSLILHRRGHWWAPYFTGMAAITGAFVGYSRIAAARHWMTDVVAGMAMGIAMGAIIPLIILEPTAGLSVVLNPKAYGLELGMMW